MIGIPMGSNILKTKKPLIRNLEADQLLESFLVTSVASILGIRFFLSLTGYPQLGGSGLHIAHVLVGGFFMMVSIVLLLAFVDRYSTSLAAVLGGFGFGAFIDEIGKFVTSDSNYFFQPAVALIYVTFVLLYVLFQSLNGHRLLTDQERVVNVLEITKDAVIDDLDVLERKSALDLLDKCDQNDPLVKALRDMLQAIDAVPIAEPGIYTQAKSLARGIYCRLIAEKWFTTALVAFFVVQSLFSLFEGTVLFIIQGIQALMHLELIHLTLTEWFGIAAPAMASVFVFIGIMRIRSSRKEAYQQFKSAVLVQIFFVQTLEFYRDQFAALVGLAANILVLAILRYMISQEETRICEIPLDPGSQGM